MFYKRVVRGEKISGSLTAEATGPTMQAFIFVFALAAMALAEEEAVKQLSAGNEQFTSRMFNEVVKSNPEKSVVMSAYSVIPPLAQLSLAAEGESHDELLKTIGIPNDNVTRVAFPLVSKQLQSLKGVVLKLASKIYIPLDYELNEGFAKDSKDVFDSEVKNIDFTKNEVAANEINAWVEDKTNNRIKDLVSPDSLSSLTRAVLVNAIYFKGSWKTQFKDTNTKDRDFHVSNDKTIQIPTMYQKGNFKYGDSEELGAQLLEMQYEGEESSFLIILPKEIEGLKTMIEKMKEPGVLEKAVSEMSYVDVDVFIPKFKIETKINLKEVLMKIGVTKIFDEEKAGLTHFLKTKETLYVSEAIQKAFIEVNEEGAEAAAANEFIILTKSGRYTKSIIFEANRPFIYALRSHSGPILFTGTFVG